jgi:hypothetical protein
MAMKALNLAILALTIACSEANTGPDRTGLEGTYTLHSIEGLRLPYESVLDWSCLPGLLGCAGRQTIRGMVITVREDGTWDAAFDWSGWTLLNGAPTYVDVPSGSMSGVWARWGTNVVFRSKSLGDDFFAGAVNGSTMTLDGNFVLTRASIR